MVDAVNDSESARETWRVASTNSGAGLWFVLLILDDEAEHCRRLEDRTRNLTHVPEPSWDDVRARAGAYEPWAEGTCQRINADQPVDELVLELMDRLAGR